MHLRSASSATANHLSACSHEQPCTSAQTMGILALGAGAPTSMQLVRLQLQLRLHA